MNSRIFHRTDKDTVRTIAYTIDFENGVIRYGGTVFHQDDGESWDRKKHIQKARERFTNAPITVRFDPQPFKGLSPGGWEDHRKREEFVLNLTFKYGSYNKNTWTSWFYGTSTPTETFTTDDFYAVQSDPIPV